MSTQLQLWGRLADSNSLSFIRDLHGVVNWQRSTRALGGYWLGDFALTAETMTRFEMAQFFNSYMGHRVQEATDGAVTWDGEIIQMDLRQDGTVSRRTLSPEYWHNKVKVAYIDPVKKSTVFTDWTEETLSSDIYGESCYLELIGQELALASAEAARDRRLAQFAWPRSWPAGGLRYTEQEPAIDELRVYLGGHVHSMNRRYYEADVASTYISDQVTVLRNASEFVAVGVHEPNTTIEVPITAAEMPIRLWDALVDLILLGDSSGNRWVGGVYNDRKFDYTPAETEVTHLWENGRLTTLNGYAVKASTIRPDIVVRMGSAMPGATPASGNVYDNPQNVYIEEVEYIAPNGYRLIPYEGAVLEGVGGA